jgi:hypothetical protein
VYCWLPFCWNGSWKVGKHEENVKVLDAMECVEHGSVDKLYWIPSKRGWFEVSLFYHVLIPHDSTHFPWRCIWQSMAHLRVKISLFVRPL